MRAPPRSLTTGRAGGTAWEKKESPSRLLSVMWRMGSGRSGAGVEFEAMIDLVFSRIGARGERGMSAGGGESARAGLITSRYTSEKYRQMNLNIFFFRGFF